MTSPAMSSATSLTMSALTTIAMMVAMMLPSIAPTVRRHHRRLRSLRVCRAGSRTTLFFAGYAAVWAAIGLAMFAMNVGLSTTAMSSPTDPHVRMWAAGVVLGGGLLQRSRWKARRLRRCAQACVDAAPCAGSFAAAWRGGRRLGIDCGLSCVPPMAVLLVSGVMDLRMMALTTAAITAERVAPAGERIARLTGTVAVLAGLVMFGLSVGA